MHGAERGIPDAINLPCQRLTCQHCGWWKRRNSPALRAWGYYYDMVPDQIQLWLEELVYPTARGMLHPVISTYTEDKDGLYLPIVAISDRRKTEDKPYYCQYYKKRLIARN